MLHDGDRILVCLSGSSASLCLLHALRQFVRARQLHHVVLAAVSLGPATGGMDPRALMLYLRDLRVRLYCEPLGEFLFSVVATQGVACSLQFRSIVIPHFFRTNINHSYWRNHTRQTPNGRPSAWLQCTRSGQHR